MTPSIARVFSFFGVAGGLALMAGSYAYLLHKSGLRVRWKPFETFAVAPKGKFRTAMVKKIPNQKMELRDETGKRQSYEIEVLEQAKLFRRQVHVGFAVLMVTILYLWIFE